METERSESATGVLPDRPGEGGQPIQSRFVRLRTLTVPLVVLLALRLPSLFEPHWYTDEAGYANVAWEMAHGKVLFLTTWNNKPPLLFWLYQVGLGISGPSEFGIHLLSTVTEVSALVGTWVLARRCLGPQRIWLAMLLAAFFLATPVFNGDLALPENFLIGVTPWAMVAVLAALRARGSARAFAWAALAGLLFAAAILIQQTAVADLAAGGLLMLVTSRRGWRLVVVTGGVAVLVVAAVMAPFVAAAGLHNVIYFLVTSYVGYTNTSLQPTFLDYLPRAAGVVLLLGGAYFARKWSVEKLLPWLWLPMLLIAYGFANRDYLHFLLPAVPAAALVVAGLDVPQWRGWRSWSVLSGVPLLGSLGIGVFLWFVLITAGLSGGSLFTLKLTGEYYPAFVGKLTGAITAAQYVSIYDQRAIAEHDAVLWIKENHLTGSTAVVWSPDSWAYLLAGLDPILPEPTIYENDEIFGTANLIERVAIDRPVVVILTSDSYTEYGPILPVLQKGYTEVEASANGELWIRSDVATKVLTAAEDHADLARSSH